MSNDVGALAPGEGCWATFLTHKGRMLGDLRVLARPHELSLDTERVALQALFDLIRRFSIGHDVDLHKRTLERGLLSLVGPGAREAAGIAAGAAPGERENDNAAFDVGGIETVAVTTDLGIDLFCDAASTGPLAAALHERGAVGVSEEAVEIVRVEHGRPRYGLDIDASTMPEEAALTERAVSFTKGCYVGQETVARLHWKGKPNRHLRGLRLSAPAANGDELRLGERVVGTLGTAVVSPRLGPIGLAIVRREAALGDVVEVGRQGTTGELVAPPFGS